MSAPTAVPNDRIRDHAELLATGPVTRAALSVAFEESSASSAEVLVGGRSFYPPMLEDIASASSSVHINQFGFRPGVVGDRFAEALVAKAAQGVPVRLVVDRQGSDPERGSQAFYERLTGRVSRSASCAQRSLVCRSAHSETTGRRAGTCAASVTSTTGRWS